MATVVSEGGSPINFEGCNSWQATLSSSGNQVRIHVTSLVLKILFKLQNSMTVGWFAYSITRTEL